MKRFLCLGLWLAACGGGGGATATQPGAAVPQQQDEENQVVVRYDLNGDDQPDVLTLDASDSFRIVEVLEGTPDGGAVDMTAARKGDAIDPAISDALADHLANSIELASATDLEVVDSAGRSITVTVFE